jgi:hypothetical protein
MVMLWVPDAVVEVVEEVLADEVAGLLRLDEALEGKHVRVSYVGKLLLYVCTTQPRRWPLI